MHKLAERIHKLAQLIDELIHELIDELIHELAELKWACLQFGFSVLPKDTLTCGARIEPPTLQWLDDPLQPPIQGQVQDRSGSVRSGSVRSGSVRNRSGSFRRGWGQCGSFQSRFWSLVSLGHMSVIKFGSFRTNPGCSGPVQTDPGQIWVISDQSRLFWTGSDKSGSVRDRCGSSPGHFGPIPVVLDRFRTGPGSSGVI